MVTIKSNKRTRELTIVCDCGCKSQFMAQYIPSDMGTRGDVPVFMLDVRDSGRHKWHGVSVYDEETMRKLLNFFKGAYEKTYPNIDK